MFSPGDGTHHPPGDIFSYPRDFFQYETRFFLGMEHYHTPGDIFSYPRDFFQYETRFFLGMEHYHTPGDIFSYPRVFWLSDRASDSVPTGQWFEPRLLWTFSFSF